jgi:hypothetical protein
MFIFKHILISCRPCSIKIVASILHFICYQPHPPSHIAIVPIRDNSNMTSDLLVCQEFATMCSLFFSTCCQTIRIFSQTISPTNLMKV